MFLRRLHLQFYIAIVGTLVAFLVCGAVVWHYFSAPRGAIWGIESATGLAATLLMEPGDGGRALDEMVGAGVTTWRSVMR